MRYPKMALPSVACKNDRPPSHMLWLIHLFIFIIIYQIARKQLSQNDNTQAAWQTSLLPGPSFLRPSVIHSFAPGPVIYIKCSEQRAD